MAHAAQVIGDRWTLLVLREIVYGVRRFDDIQTDIGSPRQVLADRLSRLVATGLLERRPYREYGQRERSEYYATATAVALYPALIALMNWGETNASLKKALTLVRRDTGARVRLAFIDDEGGIAPQAEIGAILDSTGETL